MKKSSARSGAVELNTEISLNISKVFHLIFFAELLFDVLDLSGITTTNQEVINKDNQDDNLKGLLAEV